MIDSIQKDGIDFWQYDCYTLIKCFRKAGVEMTQTVQERIFQLMRGGQTMTRQDIAEKLSLSMPTVLQNVTQLMEANILEECGTTQSNGGRKAKILRLCPEAGQVLGINIGIRQVEFVTADLLGNLQRSMYITLPFQDEPDWYVQLQSVLRDFFGRYQIDPSQILGAGISFPGIIDSQKNQVVRSHILGVEHMGLERFQKILPCPVVFDNDANCACFAQRDTHRESYIYLSLNESVGGAVMLNGKLWTGDTFQAGELGHMILVPGGRRCYCGKQGCADAYLSPQALEQDGWNIYLDHLALFATNLRMLLNIDLVIGGQIGNKIGSQLDDLIAKAAQYDQFARDINYIFPCVRQQYACALGAAGFALEQFGDKLLYKVETIF